MPHHRDVKSLYDTVINGLRDREAEWKDAARFAGVHRKTVVRIMDGSVANPGVLTVEKLAEWVRKNSRMRQQVPQ